MSEYQAPRRDMLFLLEMLVDPERERTEAFRELTPDLLEAILGEAARWAEEVLDPVYRLGDREGALLVDGQVRVPEPIRAAYERFVEGGWGSLQFDAEWGGQGLPQLVAVAVSELWKSANLGVSLCPMLTQAAAKTLLAHATDELKALFVPKLVAGEWTGTMNLTEPQAGSDLAAISTRAESQDGHYRLRGRKIFVTWGDHDMTENIVHLVLARTPGAPPGVQGLSLFLVPKNLVAADGSLAGPNEVSSVSIEEKLGIHVSPTCALTYGEGEGAIGYLVGQENQGLACMFTMMNGARLSVGVEGLAVAERAYQKALQYARERVQGQPPGHKTPAPIFHHPDVRRMLMMLKSCTEAMRALAYYSALQLDLEGAADVGRAETARKRVMVLTPIVKGWCTELAQELVSLGVQIHGGMGYIEETGAAQILRDARITTIYEGTTGIQANDLVGRKLIPDNGEVLKALLEEIAALDGTLGAAGAPLGAIRAALAQGVAAAEEAVDYVLAGSREDEQLPGAVAVNLLLLMGTLLGGWRLAHTSLVAHAALRAQPAGDESFLGAKLITARFYAEHVMPRIGGLRAAVLAGSGSVMGLSEEQFSN